MRKGKKLAAASCRGITKGQAVTYTLSDGKKIQKVAELVTRTRSVVRAVRSQHRLHYVCNEVQG
jgi:hypothetical protein